MGGIRLLNFYNTGPAASFVTQFYTKTIFFLFEQLYDCMNSLKLEKNISSDFTKSHKVVFSLSIYYGLVLRFNQGLYYKKSS